MLQREGGGWGRGVNAVTRQYIQELLPTAPQPSIFHIIVEMERDGKRNDVGGEGERGRRGKKVSGGGGMVDLQTYAEFLLLTSCRKKPGGGGVESGVVNTEMENTKKFSAVVLLVMIKLYTPCSGSGSP